MKITVTVKPNAKKNEIIKITETEYQIKTSAPAHEGKANEAVIKLLTGFFKIKKSQIGLISGLKNKKKKFEIIQATD